MNKNDLVNKVSDDTGLSKSDSAKAVDSVIDTITSELKGGGDVRLVGFGTFLVSKRKATTGRNPQTGAAIQIPAANVPKFRAGKSLKESLIQRILKLIVFVGFFVIIVFLLEKINFSQPEKKFNTDITNEIIKLK